MRPLKLSAATLGRLAPRVAVPAYDRRGIAPSIVHIGVGGSHRAHRAVHLDELLRLTGDRRWGLCGVGLLEHDRRTRDALAAQDHLYTLVERSAGGERASVIGSIVDFRFAGDEPAAVIEAMAAPGCRIVGCRIATLTITEGGYSINQGTGDFEDRHPDIRHDLEHPDRPTCSFGYLAEALDRRRRRGLPPFTVLSCDDLQGNGHVTRRMLLAFLELRDPALRAWVDRHGAFPSSMVDRITPATTEELRALVRRDFGIDDAWPEMTEPFKQWVIEGQFCQGRPEWERDGALLIDDVLPFEKIKIRLLNGSHQAMCYIGMLLGYTFVHEALCDAGIRRLVRSFMDREVTPLLPAVPGLDLEAYKSTLIERFVNPRIRDQLARLGTDGSARIPKFVLPSVLDQLARGGPTQNLAFVVASWFRFLGGVDDRGQELPINDPTAGRLRALARAGGSDPRELFSVRELFGDVLPHPAGFVAEVATFLEQFHAQGATATLAAIGES